jgi:hypothetical protein
MDRESVQDFMIWMLVLIAIHLLFESHRLRKKIEVERNER